MAEIINMPRLSDTMEEGTVATWFKKVGDTVNEGDILAEIETDKATMEFEAFYSGELLHIGIQEGGTAPVDTLLAIIGEKGEDISSYLNDSTQDGSTQDGSTQENEEQVETEKAKTETSKIAAMPDNVEIITMPRLSDTMEEGTVASWMKKVGDTVSEGDILAEIETDKATMEFESFYNGTLLHIGIQEGESAAVDSVLAIIGDKDADLEAAIAASTKATSSAKNEATPIKKEQVVAPELIVEKTLHVTSTPQTANSNNGRIIASPLAKKLAIDKGIDIASVVGSGDGGRIIKRDIENHQPSQGGG